MAWGPGIHTLTALYSLNNIALILSPIAGIITSFPSEYLYGCLAADFFVGKSKGKKAKHPHNWAGGFKFLNEACNDREAAYAYGFLSHLAADVVAHNFFVPNLFVSYHNRRGMGHLYWEMRADCLAGPEYTGIAGDILKMDHHECDDLLNIIAGKRRNKLRAKKRLFVQSVRLTDYLYATRHTLFSGKKPHRQSFNNLLAFMTHLSCRLVVDLLRHPVSSPCISHDPMGLQNLILAKQKRSFINRFNTRCKIRQFTVDPRLLDL